MKTAWAPSRCVAVTHSLHGDPERGVSPCLVGDQPVAAGRTKPFHCSSRSSQEKPIHQAGVILTLMDLGGGRHARERPLWVPAQGASPKGSGGPRCWSHRRPAQGSRGGPLQKKRQGHGRARGQGAVRPERWGTRRPAFSGPRVEVTRGGTVVRSWTRSGSRSVGVVLTDHESRVR